MNVAIGILKLSTDEGVVSEKNEASRHVYCPTGISTVTGVVTTISRCHHNVVIYKASLNSTLAPNSTNHTSTNSFSPLGTIGVLISPKSARDESSCKAFLILHRNIYERSCGVPSYYQHNSSTQPLLGIGWAFHFQLPSLPLSVLNLFHP